MKKITCALLATAALSGAALASSATGFYVGGSLGAANTNAKYSSNNSNKFATQGVVNAQQTVQVPATGTAVANGTYVSGTQISGNAAAPVATPAAAVMIGTVYPVGYPISAGYSQALKANSGKVNPQFGLFVGYGMQFGQGYVGVELFGGYDAAKVNPYDGRTGEQYSSFQLTTVKRTMNYGLALRAGFFATPTTLLYVRLGMEAGKWQAKSDMSASAIDSAALAQTAAIQPAVAAGTIGPRYYSNVADLNATQPVASKNKNSINFLAGLGAEIFVTKNMFVRMEYNYVFGPSINFDQNIAAYIPVQGTCYTHNFKISQNQFKVGVGYKF